MCVLRNNEMRHTEWIRELRDTGIESGRDRDRDEGENRQGKRGNDPPLSLLKVNIKLLMYTDHS